MLVVLGMVAQAEQKATFILTDPRMALLQMEMVWLRRKQPQVQRLQVCCNLNLKLKVLTSRTSPPDMKKICSAD